MIKNVIKKLKTFKPIKINLIVTETFNFTTAPLDMKYCKERQEKLKDKETN